MPLYPQIERRAISAVAPGHIQTDETNEPEPQGLNLPARLGGFWTWKEGDGPAPWVFQDRLPGERCAWTCTWTSRVTDRESVLVTPAHWGPITTMTDGQLAAELDDIASRPGPMAHEAHKVLACTSADWRRLARGVIGKARGNYPEHINPCNPPTIQFISPAETRRPSWAKPDGLEPPEVKSEAPAEVVGKGEPPEWMK
jgi:hypothetical protein